MPLDQLNLMLFAQIAKNLPERGIDYVPDYSANRMGIVHCAKDQYGLLPDDPMIVRHLDPSWPGSIQETAKRIFDDAHARGASPLVAANRLADELAEEPHPVWGTRNRQIIASLAADGWHEQR